MAAAVVVVVCHVRARPHLDVESQLEGFGEIKKEGITRIAKGRGYDTGDDDDGSKHQHVTPLNIRDELVLFEELGRGASGVVRKALHIPTLQLVAVKVRRVVASRVVSWVRANLNDYNGATVAARAHIRRCEAPPDGV